MSASDDFNRLFKKVSLKETFISSIKKNSPPGIDGINKSQFEDNIDANISIINNKVLNGTFVFSKYLEKLLLKGRGKCPRIISIPTIRDKIVLKSLSLILANIYSAKVSPLHQIISNISKDVILSGTYDSFIRLDIINFYPSIQHDTLLKELSKKIKRVQIINLLKDAITQCTVTKSSSNGSDKEKIGIPQGLPISNILANAYMTTIDKKFITISNIKYYRYVDDILILCKKNKICKITELINKELGNVGLSIHPVGHEKFSAGDILAGFSYLGYTFNNSIITIRKQSIDKHRESIVNTLTQYKYSKKKDIEILKWALNIRITGGLLNNERYGWLFFYSQINDLKLLASLDHFVAKQLKRFNIESCDVNIKKYLRSYHEINNNLRNSKYIPNFDSYSDQERRLLLTKIFKFNTDSLNESQVEKIFSMKLFRRLKQLEKDLSGFSPK